MAEDFGLVPGAFLEPSSSEYDSEESCEVVDGVPWYLFDSEKNAEVGI